MHWCTSLPPASHGPRKEHTGPSLGYAVHKNATVLLVATLGLRRAMPTQATVSCVGNKEMRRIPGEEETGRSNRGGTTGMVHLPRHLALEFWLCNNMSIFTHIVKMVGKKPPNL